MKTKEQGTRLNNTGMFKFPVLLCNKSKSLKVQANIL